MTVTRETYLDAITETLQDDDTLYVGGLHTREADIHDDFFDLSVVVLISGLDVNHACHAFAIAKQFIEVIGCANVIGLLISVDNHHHFVQVIDGWLLVVESVQHPEVCKQTNNLDLEPV